MGTSADPSYVMVAFTAGVEWIVRQDLRIDSKLGGITNPLNDNQPIRRR